jgi:hypothetical protein
VKILCAPQIICTLNKHVLSYFVCRKEVTSRLSSSYLCRDKKNQGQGVVTAFLNKDVEAMIFVLIHIKKGQL